MLACPNCRSVEITTLSAGGRSVCLCHDCGDPRPFAPESGIKTEFCKVCGEWMVGWDGEGGCPRCGAPYGYEGIW